MQFLDQFSKFMHLFFYIGLHYADFTYAFHTTLIRLEKTDVWPKYVGRRFWPPPLNRQLRTPLDREKKCICTRIAIFGFPPNMEKYNSFHNYKDVFQGPQLANLFLEFDIISDIFSVILCINVMFISLFQFSVMWIFTKVTCKYWIFAKTFLWLEYFKPNITFFYMYCRTPVLGLGLWVDFSFAWDNNNDKNNNDNYKNNLNFVKGTVLGDKEQGVVIRDKG